MERYRNSESTKDRSLMKPEFDTLLSAVTETFTACPDVFPVQIRAVASHKNPIPAVKRHPLPSG